MLDDTLHYDSMATDTPLGVTLPAILVPSVVILIIAVGILLVFLASRRKNSLRAKEVNQLTEMTDRISSTNKLSEFIPLCQYTCRGGFRGVSNVSRNPQGCVTKLTYCCCLVEQQEHYTPTRLHREKPTLQGIFDVDLH